MNEVGKGEVDHFIAAAVEHRFESPKIKADRLVEFDCRGHGSVYYRVHERRAVSGIRLSANWLSIG